MNKRKLQTNRSQPKKKRGVRAVHARTQRKRRQAVAATARPGELQAEVPHKSLASVWMVVIILHVVAIGVIYVAIEWNKSKLAEVELPSSSPSIDGRYEGLEPKLVKSGDTYESFAQRYNVSVEQLRELNQNTTIHAGKVLYLPKEPAPVVVRVSPNPQTQQSTARAVVVEPATQAVGAQYKVQKGDSIYRIAKKYGVSQADLMQHNGITDARHLKIGQTLKIPGN